MSKSQPRGVTPKAFKNAKKLIAEVQATPAPAPKPQPKNGQ